MTIRFGGFGRWTGRRILLADPHHRAHQERRPIPLLPRERILGAPAARRTRLGGPHALKASDAVRLARSGASAILS